MGTDRKRFMLTYRNTMNYGADSVLSFMFVAILLFVSSSAFLISHELPIPILNKNSVEEDSKKKCSFNMHISRRCRLVLNLSLHMFRAGVIFAISCFELIKLIKFM